MFQTKINVVKTDIHMVKKIIVPILIHLFVATMSFYLVVGTPITVLISVPLMLVSWISFIPMTIYLIIRGKKISRQYTVQKEVTFTKEERKIFMDSREVRVTKNVPGGRIDIALKNPDSTEEYYIELKEADEFLRFIYEKEE